MTSTQRRPTACQYYAFLRGLNLLSLLACFILGIYVFAVPTSILPNPSHLPTNPSSVSKNHPIFPLISISFAMLLNSYELHSSRSGDPINLRSKTVLVNVIAWDIVCCLCLITSPFSSFAFPSEGQHSTIIGSALQYTMIIPAVVHLIAMSSVCREETFRRREVLLREEWEASPEYIEATKSSDELKVLDIIDPALFRPSNGTHMIEYRQSTSAIAPSRS